MREDGPLFSWAESVEFAERAVQADLREQTAEAKKPGKEEGQKKILQSVAAHKYGIEDAWVETLSDQQIDDAVVHILECDTYDALKDKLKNTKTN